MRWSLRCTSTGSQAVALPCGASSSATTSASKKSLRAAEQDRPDVARARRCWKRRQAMLNSTRLVFIDETAANTKMVRLSGRCPRGERLVGCVPQGHWKTLTFVAGLRRNGMTAPCVIDGSMSGKTFLAYVEQSLAPAVQGYEARKRHENHGDCRSPIAKCKGMPNPHPVVRGRTKGRAEPGQHGCRAPFS